VTLGELRTHAEHFQRVSSRYPYVRLSALSKVSDLRATLTLDLKVELPNAYLADGISPNGVKAIERVDVILDASYPIKAPSFRLRQDFPRNIPHLNPGDGVAAPIPCLVDGSTDEFFNQYDLVDACIFALLDQMCLWLKRAALGKLANETDGWEAINRNAVFSQVVLDRDHLVGLCAGKDAGHAWLKGKYLTLSAHEDLDDDFGIWANNEIAPKFGSLKPFPFELETRTSPGSTIVAAIWPEPRCVCGDVLPDDVDTIEKLDARSVEYGLGDQFKGLLRDLENRWKNHDLPRSIPIAVIFCVRRPYRLTGRPSNIELVAYLIQLQRKQETSRQVTRPRDKVFPMRQIDTNSPALFRYISGVKQLPATSVIGCGSVGSKVAMHLARAGADVVGVSDRAMLNPHNMARHALAREPFPMWKAHELASELGRLGGRPKAYLGDVLAALASAADRELVAPPGTELLVNTTASRLVREALSGSAGGCLPSRVSEVALFARGDGAFVFLEGPSGSPSLVQLEASMYASACAVERQLLFDPATGLARVQIGDGCGSISMPMSDARLSAMAAAATEELTLMLSSDAPDAGMYSIGTRDQFNGATSWRRVQVPSFHQVAVEGGDWTLYLSDAVVRRIDLEISERRGVETGGLLVGTCNSRLRTITVVDILPAPPDSQRSSGLFVLGTSGLKASVQRRHRESGGSLFDVGTWHSHLADQGPSALDWKTAETLAESRPPPAVLLVRTPKRFLAITRSNKK